MDAIHSFHCRTKRCLVGTTLTCNILLVFRTEIPFLSTVLRIIKLKLFPVQVRFRSGSGYLKITSLFHHVLRYLRTLYIVKSLVRRRVTRRLTRFQTMHNVLKIAKHYKTVVVRLRLIFSIYICSVL